MPSLFEPLTIGELTVRNRVFMAPMTRQRSGEARVPGPLVAEYYAQRASAGLILTEATSVSPQGVGYADTPGVWNAEQVAGWRGVTEAVHRQGGVIFLQLWHVGRISDPVFLDGARPVSSSAVAAAGTVSQVRPKRDYAVPRALEAAELPGVVASFRTGAENAQRAGFDGVELHGANGYLLDQFLQDGVNRRTDAYGGSVENRARLTIEALDAAIGVFGAGRVGLHISPRGTSHDIADSDPAALFGHVAREAGARRIAFLVAREAAREDRLAPALKAAFGGPLVANDGLDGAQAQALLDAGAADAAAFGRWFVSNPDLPRRLQEGAPLAPWRGELLYGGGAEGYVDYPDLETA